MKTDLSESFAYAIQHADYWTAEHLNATVNLILDRLAAATDLWDASSGEDWVQFIAEDEIVLYLSVNFPLAVVVAGAESLLDGISVVVIVADDFHRMEYQIDPALLPGIVAHPSPNSTVNPDGFTIRELRQASL